MEISKLFVRFVVLLSLSIGVGTFIFKKAQIHSEVMNIHLDRVDQDAYIEFIKKIKFSEGLYTGGRNRMPLYPLIISLIVNDLGDNEKNNFRKIKLKAIIFTIVLFLCFLMFWWREFKELSSLIWVLILGVSYFLYPASYIQADLLFHILMLVIVFQSFRFLELNTVSIYKSISIGFLLALAHYTKASTLLYVYIFVICSFIYVIYKLPSKLRFTRIKNILIVVSVYLAVLSPYLIESKIRYSTFFYNVNTDFYLWSKNWKEVNTSGTKVFGDREGWPKMPAEKIPSMKKYFVENNIEDILNRFKKGFYKYLKTFKHPRGFTLLRYLAILLSIVTACGIFRKKQMYHLIFNELRAQTFFICTYTCIFFCGAIFYAPIASGWRFMGVIYLPLMVFLYLVLSKLLKDDKISFFKNREYNTIQVLNFITLFFFMIFDFFRINDGLVRYVYTGN